MSEMVTQSRAWAAAFAAFSPSRVGGKLTNPEHRASCGSVAFLSEAFLFFKNQDRVGTDKMLDAF